MDLMQDLLEAVNETISGLLSMLSKLSYESPSDVDRHDDSVEEIKRDLTFLRSVRSDLENRIAS